MLTGAIARTALLTAAARAIESARDDAIARDPYARSLAGDEGMRMIAAQADPRPLASLAVRSRYLDDALTKAIDAGITQVVILAAGLDARALRMARPSGAKPITWVEIDRAEVLAYKRAVLGEARAAAAIVDVAVDLREAALPSILAAHGVAIGVKTAWIAEGLFPYFDESEARALVATIASMSAPGSLLAFDVPGRSSLDPDGPMARHLAELAASGAPWRLGTDDPASLVAPWFAADVVHVGHPRAHFGRLAAAPRETPPVNGPVTWLVSATRL